MPGSPSHASTLERRQPGHERRRRRGRGNHYFAHHSLVHAYFRPSTHTTSCPWKGVAHVYDVLVGDAVNANAAWYYPEPKEVTA